MLKGNHEGRGAVRHSKVPEPELNQEDAPADSTQAVSDYQKQAGSQQGGGCERDQSSRRQAGR